MYISKVSLINYKNFSNAKFLFNKGINTIIGENGSGKTNVFKAIRLLLEDTSLHYSYKLNENDFNRILSGDSWKGHWIIISIEFSDLTNEEAIQSLFIHGAGIAEEDYVKNASYNLFFRPKADIRQSLSELERGDKAGLNRILDEISIEENYETFFTGKSTADFNDPEVYKELVGDFDNVVFPAKIDSLKFGTKIPHQLSISKEVSFTFIQALRDVVSDFHNNRTNPLLTLLKNKSGEIKDEDYKPISELVDDLNQGIEELDDVQNIRKDIKSTIQDAVGLTYSPSSLSIKSSLPSEADKLLQSLKLYIGEPNEEYEGGIHELSLGGANLIFLTLKLLEFKYQKSKDTFANFLIIEEPEAHIHNHIQKTLFDKLDYGDTQIIYSTHSTQISEVSNVDNINILAKKLNFAEVYQPSKGLSPKEINQIQRYLDAIRTNLLFAKGVILVEGDAEEILIPKMVKEVYGVSLDELGISLINIRSTGFKNIAQLFHDNRIRRKCSILTDLDTAICDTTIKDGDSDSLKKYRKKVKKSEKSGLERKEILDEFEKDNDWVKVFYAEYTFEVDFLCEDNGEEVCAIVDDVYSEKNTIEKSKKELKDTDVSVFGKRILTMAKQEGKGWFAIMLGKYVSYKTIIPEYIVDAVLFTKESYPNNVIANIIQYRISKYSEDNDKLNFNSLEEILAKYRGNDASINDVIMEVKALIPSDQVLTFLNKIK
ncbi:ATP-dependent nuclease [Tenacibaculum maritimum]|uniref:ATP-dependent nuclease n=1 Tax=Tenacibaculum maritimum TaxID=107401 RepID=UPI0012E600CC|nr:AAA family ATPase [Tenacibaculum maritimum]CAA0151581.1 Predicted ATP-dependent endonuclease of the OLD family, contains P-loop ATPase and TOPRIM domains [Tenacibaculum maritimum]CAA0155080.1 Predicted ATP-dependent endonuclease of the OLD family, contains P-loop ATPase and TOPRIM domains [Tenacibaculum maritimum]CAA0155653.1 Predicted ATP-dependent endonuclease of the OLD family, contains P-loop ATPase and TOPRIM domains [Tenacibaculum maritimum]CAA0245418.1 Predicted ATP-dependent endonucl